jgi:lipopolysaccharide/colanic/teichoic acid biosynthesis glycosyltransferase
VLQYPQRAAVDRRSFLRSRRFQLAGALLFAVLLPWLFMVLITPTLFDLQLIRNTVVGNLIATLGGFYLYRSITVYPGIRSSYFIIPTFGASYALVAFGYLLLRLEYSRILLTVGLVACLLWYYAVFFLHQRDRSLRIGIVPFGEVDSLHVIDSIEWVRLTSADAEQRRRYDLLVADFRSDLPEEWEAFLADSALAGVTILHVKQLRESLTGRVEIDHLSENNFGSLIPALAYIKLKGLIDFIAAAAIGIVLLPVLAGVAAAVRWDSPGPVLFRQRRVGYGGRVFTVFKFRTMCNGGSDDEGDERSSAITNHGDPRVTRLGRLLRRSRVDELPQIINILRGEMSWIGPRPEAEVLSKWYEAELPFYRYRHIVKPGISGWAQVNQGHVAEVEDVLWKLQYDFYYIKNFSPWLDLLIVFKTLRTVLTGFGSR